MNYAFKLGQMMAVAGKPLIFPEYEVFTFCSVKGNGYVRNGWSLFCILLVSSSVWLMSLEL